MSKDKARSEQNANQPATLAQEIDRLCGDDCFKASQRHKRLLRYLGEHSTDGRGPKAYSIGLDVFERSATFDPNVDPIVRVEVSRLRVAIQNYYEYRPRTATLKIPPGSYTVVFEHNYDDGQPPQSAIGEYFPQPKLGVPTILTGNSLALLAAGVLATLALQLVQLAMMMKG